MCSSSLVKLCNLEIHCQTQGILKHFTPDIGTGCVDTLWHCIKSPFCTAETHSWSLSARQMYYTQKELSIQWNLCIILIVVFLVYCAIIYLHKCSCSYIALTECMFCSHINHLSAWVYVIIVSRGYSLY